MFTKYINSNRVAISTLAAVAIVSLQAVALDQGHIASTPRGTVEVGELTLVRMDATPIASVNLPEVVVVAKRESTGSYFAIASELPEVVVVATRIASMVAQAGTTPQGHSAAAQGSVEGALLK